MIKKKTNPKSSNKSRTAKISKIVKANRKNQLKADDIPVTVAHLNLFKKELNSKVTSIELNMKGLELTVKSLEQRMEARFTEVESRFSKIDSTLEKMMELYHRQSVRLEEQATSNKIVFDHLNMLFERQEKLEKDTDQKIKNIQDAIKGV